MIFDSADGAADAAPAQAKRRKKQLRQQHQRLRRQKTLRSGYRQRRSRSDRNPGESWHKVEAEQSLITVEGDKASMEFRLRLQAP